MGASIAAPRWRDLGVRQPYDSGPIAISTQAEHQPRMRGTTFRVDRHDCPCGQRKGTLGGPMEWERDKMAATELSFQNGGRGGRPAVSAQSAAISGERRAMISRVQARECGPEAQRVHRGLPRIRRSASRRWT
jgi:hypothetical protein